MRRILAVFVALAGLAALTLPLRQDARAGLTPRELERTVYAVAAGSSEMRRRALGRLVARGQPDVAPALIQYLRFLPDNPEIIAALNALTRAGIEGGWRDWMLWQEVHPEIVPYDGFSAFKAQVLARIDRNYMRFLRADVPHEIRLEEITWGGVPAADGIPALINPKHIPAAEATYLEPDELVFGIEINGDARAYPLRIMNWHEMANDVVGGVPVALAYCTLCGSAILYETKVVGRDQPFVFGTSGLLYRSNKLMFDKQTDSLWNQFTGRPVVGLLAGSGIELDTRPVAITSWAKWRAREPGTVVLSLDTGFARDYRPGRPYGAYFASPDLMFPTSVPPPRFGLAPKDYVFGLRVTGHEKAWPLALFEGGAVINDRVEDLALVLVGDAATRTVRAYASAGNRFAPVAGSLDTLSAGDTLWKVTEDALVAPDGRRLERLPGHVAYWFAWYGFNPGAPLGETR